jgi:hypothetical protein
LIAWKDVYTAIASASYRKGIIDSLELTLADDMILERMEPALSVKGKFSVIQKISGAYAS